MFLFVFVIALLWSSKKYRLLKRLRLSRKRQTRLILLALGCSIIASIRLVTAYEPLFFAETLDLPALRVYMAAQTARRNIEAYQELENKVSADIDLKEKQQPDTKRRLHSR